MTDSIQKEIKDALATIRDKWLVWKYPQGGFEIFEEQSRAIILTTFPTDANGRFDGSIIAKFPTWLLHQQTVIEQLQESVRYWQDDAKRLEGISIRKEAFITSIGKELEQKDAEIKKLNEILNGYEIVSDLYASKIELQAEENKRLREVLKSTTHELQEWVRSFKDQAHAEALEFVDKVIANSYSLQKSLSSIGGKK